MEQDGPGRFITKEGQLSLFGNTWKAFKLKKKVVTRHTTIEFDLRVDELAEGKFLICLVTSVATVKTLDLTHEPEHS